VEPRKEEEEGKEEFEGCLRCCYSWGKPQDSGPLEEKQTRDLPNTKSGEANEDCQSMNRVCPEFQ
jgi:hypothetical protein